MNKKGYPVMVLCIFLILSTSANSSIQAQNTTQEQVYFEDFESGLAQGWELQQGWEIIVEEGNRVLSGQGHAWADSNQSFHNSSISFRLKLLRGDIHLVFHMNDTGRYYINFNSSGSRLNKQYWPNTFIDLVSNHIQHPQNTWHDVEIISQDSTLSLIFNNITEWTYTDPDPLNFGRLAFETLVNSQAYIDDLVVSINTATEQPTHIAIESLLWQYTGGPLGGLGYDVRIHPLNPEMMFITDAFSGVFISLDGGMNWFPSNEGIMVRRGSSGDAIPIFCLTIDPLNPDIIWAGTEEWLGVFKSTDRGSTWQSLTKGITEKYGISFRGFTIDPSDSDVVYAAAEVASWEGGKPERIGLGFDMTKGVVYKTTDGGNNWRAVWRGENLARYIWIDPRDSNVLYISTGIFDREAYNSDPETYQPGGEGVLKSTDGGQTWEHINNGLKNLYVGSLFMHPTNPEILLAGTGNLAYPTGNGIYITTNAGLNWEHVLQDDNITSVEFSSSNPDIAYAGSTNKVYRSENGGFTWKVVSGGREKAWGTSNVMGGFPIDFQVDPRNPDRIFANAYGGGNFMSDDGGRTWIDASRGYTGAIMRKIVIDPDQPARVLAVARSGIFTSYDGGMNWDGLNYSPIFRLEWTSIAIHPTEGQHILAGSDHGGPLALSLDGGFSWKIVEEIQDSNVRWSDIVFAPSDPNIVYASTSGTFMPGYFDYPKVGKGVFISTNGGHSWRPANDDLSKDASVVSLAVHPHHPEVVYAATSNQGLLKTIDGGATWETVAGISSSLRGTFVAVNPNNPEIVFTGFDRQAIFISSDGGQTWLRSASGMPPEASIISVVFNPVQPLEVIYASDVFSGIYRSDDSGKTWHAINNGLLMRAVNALAISNDGLHLYAASEGAGVFRLDLSGQPPKPATIPITVTPTPTSQPIVSTPKPTITPRAEVPTEPIPTQETAAGISPWLLPLAGAGLFILGAVTTFLIAYLLKKGS